MTADRILRRSLLLPYQLFTLVLFTVLFLLCVLAIVVAGLGDPGGDRANRCLRYWARANLALTGLRVQVEGLDRLDRRATYVFMPNHASFLDILLTLAYIPYNFRMIIKEEIFTVPLVGWVLRRSGQIPLNRSSPRKGLRSLRRASRLIHKGVSVVVFPEGTRTANGDIGDFKAALFVLPIRSGAAVVPVLIEGTFAALKRGSVFLRPVPLKLTFYAPVAADSFTEHDRVLYAEKVRAIFVSSRSPAQASS